VAPSVAYLKTLPSYIQGSVRQTLATLVPAHHFKSPRNPPIVLIPGAFCTASVMNRLGIALQAQGRSVVVAPTFPYYLSAAANTCRLDEAATRFIDFLVALADQGVREVDLAGHSNGGLIALLAEERVRAQAIPCRVRRQRLVTMATPFGGFPLARPLKPLLPFCHDLQAGCATLRRAESAGDLVVRTLVAGADSLIPPIRQSLDGKRKTVMEGFQHMDFIVGERARVARTATEVLRWLRNGCSA